MDTNEGIERLEQIFGSRMGTLGFQIVQLSQTGQPCDVTFYDRKPLLDVRIDPQIALALMYGAGARTLREKLERIKFSNGAVAGIDDIWTVNPMPKGGFTKDELAAVDIAEAEEKVGPNGETLRKMIGDTHHCESREEEDKYLRRFIAS